MNFADRSDHLNAKAASYLDLSDAERIEKINSHRWIPYARAQEIHAKLDDLFYHPKVARMPSLLVCGPSNAGKSVLLERYAELRNAPNGKEPKLPVLMVQAPSKPDEREFYLLCLTKLFVPYRASEKAVRLQTQMVTVLQNLQTRMLIIDEVHHLLGGSGIKQRIFLNTLKFLSNELRIPIVAIGTKDALNAFQVDPQIGNRFEPVAVPRWCHGEEYERLLAGFEMSTPLREPSYLADEPLASKLLVMSEGLIGELAELLRRAAAAAIRSGRERIDTSLLNSVSWVLPSQRYDNALAAAFNETSVL